MIKLWFSFYFTDDHLELNVYFCGFAVFTVFILCLCISPHYKYKKSSKIIITILLNIWNIVNIQKTLQILLQTIVRWHGLWKLFKPQKATDRVYKPWYVNISGRSNNIGNLLVYQSSYLYWILDIGYWLIQLLLAYLKNTLLYAS